VRVVARNKKARHNYQVVEEYEAGIALKGSEVKSVRAGKVSISDSYARVKDGELWLENMFIAPYDSASVFGHDPKRPRKLLMHKKEIVRLAGKVAQKGYTLVPLEVYINDRGLVKVKLALAKGLKKHDKRAAIIEREIKRKMEREAKRWL
jgi:SsrA-binding protein